jgi:hypothetical protein
MFHPYFMPKLGRWLHATVLHSTPVAIEYTAAPDPAIPAEFAARIRSQFERLGLAKIYPVVSARDLSNLQRQLSLHFSEAAQVRAYLLETAEMAFANDANAWRGALHEALGNDDWYCAGGFA